MSDEKNPVEELLKSLQEGGSPDEPFMVLGGEEAGEPQPEPEPEELLLENQLVSLTGKSGPEEDAPDITLRGRIRGLAPINTPFGVMGFDYIVQLEDPSLLPTSNPEKSYEYTCITAPKEMITVIEE